MPAAKSFTFICGQDDFLVGRLGSERFGALAPEVTDDFGRETISGFAGNVAEAATAVNRFREAVQTLPMFGGRKVVWLKDVNFLADTVTGRADSTLVLLDQLKDILQGVKPEDTAVLITAAPVDRRRSFLKWCEQNADFVLIDDGGEGGEEALASVVLAEAARLGVSFGPGAVDLLLAKIGPNTRLLVQETGKLASFATPVDSFGKARSGGPPDRSPGKRSGLSQDDLRISNERLDAAVQPYLSKPLTETIVITEAHVAELTPNVAEGDFFEATEAFFSGDLKWTLAALQRHFFAGGDSRPVIAALQSRNRLLLQVRVLLDAGDIRMGDRGMEGLSRAAAIHGPRFGEAAAVKSPFNIFTQHPFYLGKLVGGSKLPTLRRFIDNQQEFIAAFEEIVRRPDEQEEVMRDMAARCLTG